VPVTLAAEVVNTALITGAELVLTGVERVVQGSGKSARAYTTIFHSHSIRIPTPPQWEGGHEYVATVPVPLPPNKPSSFAGRQNFIEWTATLRVAIGNGADVEESAPVPVLPQRVGGPPRPPASPGYNLPALGPLNAAISFTCPVTGENMPVFHAGQQVPYVLRLAPQGNFKGHRVWVELAYQVTGQGDHEALTVTRRHVLIEQKSAAAVEERGLLDIPPTAPLTYDGAHLRLHWAVTVRHEQPWGQDQRQVFEVLMVPMDV